MSVLKASRLPACASWMRACSSIRDDFITMRKTTNQYFTKTEDSPKTGWGPETAPHPVFGLLLMVSRSTNTDNKNGLGCPAVPKQIQDSPDDHPQRRRPGKDSRKMGRTGIWRMNPRKTAASGAAKIIARAGRQSCWRLEIVSCWNSPNQGARRNQEMTSGTNAAPMRGRKDMFISPCMAKPM